MEQQDRDLYDLVIVGAGVSGAAQFFASGAYTNIKRVALIEKEVSAGLINSKPTNNSQTLHEGDIETNYNFDKAKAVKKKASFTRKYVTKKADPLMCLQGPKMVFGAGAREYDFLSERFETFKGLYPTLERLEYDELAKREPKMFEGRDPKEQVIGLYNVDGMTVDYGRLAASLVRDAEDVFQKDSTRTGDIFFNTKVTQITRVAEGYQINIGSRQITTRFVSFCAGAHSMYFAKMMNIADAKDMSLLCIAGNFYYTPKYLTQKYIQYKARTCHFLQCMGIV